jgi:cytochrome c5
MFAKSIFRLLLIPALAMAMVGAIALAEGGPVLQPDVAAPASPAPVSLQGVAAPATVSPETPEVAAPPADALAPAEAPEKKRKIKKVSPVLDPVGEGKMLFETRCATCHSVPRPNAHTLSEWPECINRMAARSYLRDSDTQLMIKYLEQELKPHSSSEWDQPAS